MATTTVLPALDPFDFDRTLEFVGGFSPQAGEQTIDGGRLRKALNIDDACVVCDMVAATGGVELTTHGDDHHDAAAAELVTRMLGLRHELAPLYEIARDDPVMAPLVRATYGFHHVEFPTPFECAAWGVLNQRVGQRVARRWKDAITEAHGPSTTVDGVTHRAFPSARVVRDAPDLDRLVPNGQRHRALVNVAEAFAEIDEDWLRTAGFDEVRDRLTSISGVGDWTATFVLSRGLSRFDGIILLPRFVTEIAALYGVDEADVPGIAARYEPAPGLWLFILRVAGTYGAVRGGAGT